ncbi:hypothetical protein [Streptomyces sp. NPDC059909]|uniref:hypothetical protein n=1 Tax=Streptomyces sp. NPDC059909 TaxID=3346998 RepID=UPI0036687575
MLADACRYVREEAQRRLAEQEDEWRSVVPRLATWLDLADGAAAAKPVLTQVKRARAWLKDVQAELRDARMSSIAEQAQEIWRYLSQESNVTLGAVTLNGSENYNGRAVALNVTVDDVDASALGVVSQGELFSLALALFLPRAMSVRSPFNFIVIDDPVQSMDPRKVEGLARLLDAIAKTHQVVVFSHDTRLPDAVRFHRIKATILEVGRFRHSKVTVRPRRRPGQAGTGSRPCGRQGPQGHCGCPRRGPPGTVSPCPGGRAPGVGPPHPARHRHGPRHDRGPRRQGP